MSAAFVAITGARSSRICGEHGDHVTGAHAAAARAHGDRPPPHDP
ncbi:hypothetical protein ABZ568_02370 [Streptomyces olindensis]|uniref:Uncharacterized protein n=1 Tax=Streptomyces olindensis TaxID=358823 RepID=A0ABV2XMS6_9ACTN